VSSGRAGTARVPIVLVHGLIVTSRYFVAIALELGSDFTLLAPDLPGYGMSDDPPSLPTIEDLGDAVAACARAAGHDRVALVANSFGAQIAIETAIRHERLVDRVVLVGPTADPCARTFPRQYIRWQRCAPDEHLSAVPVMARDVADMGPRLALHLVRAMLTHRIEDRLPLVNAPALVVRGGRDRVVPHRWARQAAELLPRGRLEILPGYAHMPHWSGAVALAPMVRRFLLQ
jgi:pimeloyl-ACP methyl ester carboxylesterase